MLKAGSNPSRRLNLQKQAAARTKELSALNAIAATVSQSLDLSEILDTALEQVLQVMEIDAGGIYLLDERSGTLNIKAQRGFDAALVEKIDALQVGEGFSGEVALSGTPLVVKNIAADPRLTRSAVAEAGFHSVAVVPLSSKGKVPGTLFVIKRGRREFSDPDIELLTSIGRQIGIAVENAQLYSAEKRRAEQFRAIAEVSRYLTLTLNEAELLQQVVQVIQQIFGYYHVGIGLVEEDELVYRVGAGSLWDDPDFQFKPARLKIGEEGLGGWVAATGEPLLVPDVSQEPSYIWMEGSATQSELTVPILVKGKVIGVLDAQSERLDAFDKTDLTVFQSLADQAGAAIENARLFRAERRRAEQFRVIGEVGQRIASAFNIENLLEQMARLIQESFSYDHVGIGLIEGDEVVSKAEAGAYVDAYHSIRIKLGQGDWGWVAVHGEACLSPDVSRNLHFHHAPGAETIRSHLCVPLKSKDEVIGVLSAASDRLNAFDESDLIVLQSLAHQAAVAVENIRYYERAQHLAVMEERSRLARELHDAVTQTIFSTSLLAEALPEVWENDPHEGRQVIQELRRLSRGALAEMRTLLLELRPAALAETRLEDLLRQLGEAASGREGIPVTVLIEGQGTLPPDVHIALYRIAQEALNNIVKHARANRVTVRLCFSCLERDDLEQVPSLSVLLSIHDDGCGFNSAQVLPDHLGLGIMEERAQAIGASLTIDSQPGEGTQVTILWEQETR